MPLRQLLRHKLLRHQFAYLAAVLLLMPTLVASGGGGFGGGGGGGGGGSRSGGGGGYRGGGSRTQVDQVYQLGQQVYQSRVKLGSFNAKSFEAHIRGLEQAASWASADNNQRAPNFYQMAGHLSDKQYDGLRRYLEQRHELTIPERKSDPDYAFAVRWLLKPGAAYATDELNLSAKKSRSRSKKSDDEQEPAKTLTAAEKQAQAQRLYVLHRLTDQLPMIRRGYGGKNAITYDTESFDAQAVRLSDQEVNALRHYAQQRFELDIKTLTTTEATNYQRATHLLMKDGDDALSDRSTIPERERRDQRTFLRQLERSLPRGSARVSRWAGRMTPEDWQALTTYARLRHDLVPEA